MKKILYLFSLMAGIALLVLSCDSDLEGTTFELKDNDVFVSFLANELTQEMVAADNNQIKVEIYRAGNTSGALEVPLTLVTKSDNATYKGVFSVSDASFAAGESKTHAVITYDDLDALNPSIKYELVLELADKDQLLPGAVEKVSITAQRKLTYKAFSKGTFASQFFGDSWAVDVEKAEEADFYKIIDCYVEGYDIVFSVSSDNTIAFDEQNTGYEHPSYGMVSIAVPDPADEAPDSFQDGKVFTLYGKFWVSAGSFGVAQETLTLND